MATVINNPNPGTSDSGGGMGFLAGIVLLVVVVFLFIIYGLPALRQSAGPQINVPDKVDVNVQTPNQGAQPQGQTQN